MFSELEKYKNVGNFRPEKLRDPSFSKTSWSYWSDYIDRNQNLAWFKGSSKNQKTNYYNFRTDNFNITEDGTFVDIRLGAYNKIEPTGSYDVE